MRSLKEQLSQLKQDLGVTATNLDREITAYWREFLNLEEGKEQSMRQGLNLLNAQAQCSWGWFEGPHCEVKGIENLVWVGSQLFCPKHAKLVQAAIKRKEQSR